MIYGYVRVSTDEQGASGLGMGAQQQAIERWCSGQAHEIVTEIGSGAGAQPALAGLLERIGTGDTLVVSKLDRLSRRALKNLEIADSLRRKDVALVILDLGLDTRTPVGKMMLGVMALLSELERDYISERTKAALAVKSARGELARPDRRTSPDAVAYMRNLRLGGATLRQISQALTDEGFKTAQGGQWRPGTIAYLLKQ
jgi:DNA invertase Pin-like site-specific DNA recombinase